MPSRVLIPRESPLYATLERLAGDQRVVLFAGLPGTGKSLLVQQLALIAHGAGRALHLLQWDVARAPFETAELLGRYPERAGVTHPAIRQAVGLWAREAVFRWHADHPDRAHLLLGEVPLLGERLSALAEVRPDAAEPLLAGTVTRFVIPVPSGPVRQHIEATRARTFATPAHEREAADAPPPVLRALWRELHDLGVRLGIAAAALAGDIPYDPRVYAAVYQHLLRHRPTKPSGWTRSCRLAAPSTTWTSPPANWPRRPRRSPRPCAASSTLLIGVAARHWGSSYATSAASRLPHSSQHAIAIRCRLRHTGCNVELIRVMPGIRA